MNSACSCHKGRPAAARAPHRKPQFGHARRLAGLLVPGTLLILLPKCPLCLAAYVALGTGFTLSYASAQILLRALILLCLGALALCGAKRLLRFSSTKQTVHFQPTPAS
jgi:Flp pilus assembly protein TadB